jgi:hypothetical protein
MTKIILFLVIPFWVSQAALSYGRGYEAKKKAGEYEVEIKIDRNPPVVGENNITIEIKDAAGKKVTDSKVLVNYYMPPMPRMPPMNYRTDAKLNGNEFRAYMKLIMSGPWYIVVIINRGGKISTAKFNIEAW